PDLVAAAGDVFLGVDPGGEDDFARRLLAGEDLEGELDRVRTTRGVEERRVEDALLDVLDALVGQGVDAHEPQLVVVRAEAARLLRGEPGAVRARVVREVDAVEEALVALLARRRGHEALELDDLSLPAQRVEGPAPGLSPDL